MMEAPCTFASLPKPLDGENGRTYAAAVHGLRGGRKRKRHEAVVGVDGESVNVYNVQNQSLITSYALPPQTYLCCTPCSTYRRASKPAPAQRRTYVVLRDGPTDRKRRVVCFSENLGGESVLKDGQLTPGAKTERSLLSDDVVSLDVLPLSGAGDQEHAILVTYKDGRADCISGDLSTALWEYDPFSKAGASVIDDVELATVTDLDTARKGLLAGREDVIAQLDPTLPVSHLPSLRNLLCQILRLREKRYLRVYAVRGISLDGLQRQRAPLQQVLDYEIPSLKSTLKASFEFHVATGKLHQLLDGRVVSFDLSGTVPRVVSTLGSSFNPIRSFARLSAASVCVAFLDCVAIHETKYGAMQASTPLHHENGDWAPLTLIASYSDLGLVLALLGNKLQIIQLTADQRPNKRHRTSDTLLIDVLAKGDTSGVKWKNEKRARKWDDWKRQVDGAASNDYPQELEDLAAQALGLKRETELAMQQGPNVQDFAQGSTVHELPWDLSPSSIAAASPDHRKVLYLLSRCFRVETQGHTGMTFITSSGLVLKMLALGGFLSTAYCQQAQQYQQSDTSAAQSTIPSGSVIPAISRFDADFQLMHDMLMLPVHWEVEEMVSALRILMQSFDDQIDGNAARPALPGAHQAQKLTNGAQDVVMADNTDVESHLELESMAAEKELNFALSALATGLELRSNTLRLILSRLRAFPRASVTKAMRATMSHKDLIFFIQILRIELADGGWTSRYVDGAEDTEELDRVAPWMNGATEATGPSDQAIKAIGELLNCAIDAIGTTGFLVGLSADSYSVQDLISSLRTEVSAGLEGLYEVDVLGTTLRDLERYGATARLPKQRDILDADHNYTLPLGFRTQDSLLGSKLTGKRGNWGKQLRKKAISMRVGKYSIDRIRI